MPNPFTKWAQQNTHSDPPPHSSGAKKVAATSPFPIPTQKERGGKISFFGFQKNARRGFIAFQAFSCGRQCI